MIGLNDLLDSSSEENETDEENNELDEANVFLKHLRKCFIATDQTSYCEYSLNPDLRVFDHQLCKRTAEIADDQFRRILSRRIDADSYEYIRINKAKENHYAKRFSDIEGSFENESKNQNLAFNSESESESKEQVLFEKRTFEEVKDSFKAFNSALTEMISKQPAFKNEFVYYSKFEAQNSQGQDPNSIQSLCIYLPMCDTEPATNTAKTKKNFMQIKVYKFARISDLIGLVCYKYKSEKREPALKYDNVNGYHLKIADDTGEVETELSELESFNLVGKFGFSHLALIENSSYLSESNANKKINVKIYFTDESPQMTLTFDSDHVQMVNIFNEVLKRKFYQTNKYCPTLAYKMEHKDEPGIAIDLENATLNHFRTHEFYFYRLNSVRRDSSVLNSESSSTIDATRIIKESIEFNVEYLSRWQRVPFKIELSKDSFELEEIKPVQLTKLRLKVKNSSFYTIPMKFVVNCSIQKKNASNKAQFRVIVAEEDTDNQQMIVYKNLDFECSIELAEKITAAFSHLMIYCNSPYVRQYNNLEKTQLTKWSRKLYKLKNKGQSFIV